MTELTEIQKEIAGILLQCAKQETVIYLGDLMNEFHLSRKVIGPDIGAVSRLCKDLDLPLLSVLGFSKSTRKTGSGYINEFYPEAKDTGKENEICEKDIEKVYAQQDWGKLEEYLYGVKLLTLEGSESITASEGDSKQVNIISRARDTKLKAECIRVKGCKCAICGFDSAKIYGEQFAGKIEVHHDIAINQGQRITSVDDLFPVCPNCHMILHLKPGKESYKIQEVIDFINSAR